MVFFLKQLPPMLQQQLPEVIKEHLPRSSDPHEFSLISLEACLNHFSFSSLKFLNRTKVKMACVTFSEDWNRGDGNGCLGRLLMLLAVLISISKAEKLYFCHMSRQTAAIPSFPATRSSNTIQMRSRCISQPLGRFHQASIFHYPYINLLKRVTDFSTDNITQA